MAFKKPGFLFYRELGKEIHILGFDDRDSIKKRRGEIAHNVTLFISFCFNVSSTNYVFKNKVPSF